MIVLIDNYDSFLYNLSQYFKTLKQHVVIFRNDEISIPQLQDLNPTHLVISAGPSVPKHAGICKQAIVEMSKSIPILGICLGHQAIIEAFGGTLEQAHPIYHGKTSIITHNNSTLFKNIPSPFNAGRYHSWQAAPNNLPHCLQTDAQVQHQGSIMAVSHCTLPVFGVQFHPESVMTKQGHQILKNFIDIKKSPEA